MENQFQNLNQDFCGCNNNDQEVVQLQKSQSSISDMNVQDLENPHSSKLYQIENQLVDSLEKYLNLGENAYQPVNWSPPDYEDDSISHTNVALQNLDHPEVSNQKELEVSNFVQQSQPKQRKRKSPQSKKIKKNKQNSSRNLRQRSNNTLQFVLDKVNEWRHYYLHGIDKNGQCVKLNLESSAQIVGIPRKTLDDYFGQIKFGQQTSFDFQKNLTNKIGVLRSHNKKTKLKQNYNRKNSQTSLENEEDTKNFKSHDVSDINDDEILNLES